MPSNRLENSARPKPALLALREAEGSGVEGSVANVSAASRPEPRRPVCVAETAAKDLPNPSFLIATRAYSRQELTHWKQRAATLSDRDKIHIVHGLENSSTSRSIPHPGIEKRLQTARNVRLATCIVVRYYPASRMEDT